MLLQPALRMIGVGDAAVGGDGAKDGDVDEGACGSFVDERVEKRGDADAEVCVLGWGSTWAAIDSAVQQAQRDGLKVAWVHLTHLSPLPADLGDVLRRFPKVLVPELNLGQLCRIVRAEYLIDAVSVSKVQGLPFTASELLATIREHLS